MISVSTLTEPQQRCEVEQVLGEGATLERLRVKRSSVLVLQEAERLTGDLPAQILGGLRSLIEDHQDPAPRLVIFTHQPSRFLRKGLHADFSDLVDLCRMYHLEPLRLGDPCGKGSMTVDSDCLQWTGGLAQLVEQYQGLRSRGLTAEAAGWSLVDSFPTNLESWRARLAEVLIESVEGAQWARSAWNRVVLPVGLPRPVFDLVLGGWLYRSSNVDGPDGWRMPLAHREWAVEVFQDPTRFHLTPSPSGIRRSP